MPEANDRLTCVIESLDGTWHRPFTTLELAALQSLVEPEEQFELDGLSDQAWRERIGNAVPPAAAEAIAHVMGTTLLLAAAGETFMLNSMPIWVRPVAIGLSVAQQGVSPTKIFTSSLKSKVWSLNFLKLIRRSDSMSTFQILMK
ncbi:hypothetical protein [Pseudomonas sp. 31 E 6]|nr:hypothetical protein [Pseudomonas sp. 31 E 5]CRM10437.1 hypothetical protein [Pseudomonas sp. 31 E 6]